jgi:hypothetical protein
MCVDWGRDMLGNKDKLIIVSSRAVNQDPQVYGTKALPVFQGDHPLAKLCIEQINRKIHEGGQCPPFKVKKGGVGNWWKDFGRCFTPAVHGVHTGAEDGPFA